MSVKGRQNASRFETNLVALASSHSGYRLWMGNGVDGKCRSPSFLSS